MSTENTAQPNLDIIYRQFTNDQFANYVGIKLNEVKPGFASVSMNIEKYLLNSLGTTHGGAIFTLADFALAVASNSHGEAAVATNVNINYIKATSIGDILKATALEESRTRKTGLYRIEVYNQKEEKIALATASVYRLGKSLTGELGKWG